MDESLYALSVKWNLYASRDAKFSWSCIDIFWNTVPIRYRKFKLWNVQLLNYTTVLNSREPWKIINTRLTVNSITTVATFGINNSRQKHKARSIIFLRYYRWISPFHVNHGGPKLDQRMVWHYVGICQGRWINPTVGNYFGPKSKVTLIQQYCQQNANVGFKKDLYLRISSNFTFFNKQHSFEKSNINNILRTVLVYG